MAYSHDFHHPAKGLLILELDDGTVMQYNLMGITANIDYEEDEIVERSGSGAVAVSFVKTSHTLELQAHIRNGTIVKPGGAGKSV